MGRGHLRGGGGGVISLGSIFSLSRLKNDYFEVVILNGIILCLKAYTLS